MPSISTPLFRQHCLAGKLSKYCWIAFPILLRTHARALLTVCLAFFLDSDRQLIQIFSLSRWQHAKIGRQDPIKFAKVENLADVFRWCSVWNFKYVVLGVPFDSCSHGTGKDTAHFLARAVVNQNPMLTRV